MDDTEMTSSRPRRRWGLRLFILGLALLLLGLVLMVLQPNYLLDPAEGEGSATTPAAIGIVTAVSGLITSVAGLITAIAALRTKRDEPSNVKRKKGQRRR